MSDRSSNASASAFGWDFQCNAAIILMLNNIKRAASVRVEGATEDIEIALDNGEKIYAQAKGCVNPDDAHNARAKLTKAIETLSQAAKKGDAGSLIYVTNLINPFSDKKTIGRFAGPSASVPFKELPESCQNTIKKICEQSAETSGLPVDRLHVFVFSFVGDGDNRYRIVKDSVCEMLEMVGLSDRGWGPKALKRWQLEFNHNSSQMDTAVVIDKQAMIWPLIVWACESSKPMSCFEGMDEADVSAIQLKYEAVIGEKADRFEFVTQVLSAYDDFKKKCLVRPMGPNDIAPTFVREEWTQFKSEFDGSGLPENHERALIQLTLEKIIKSRLVIDKVRKEVNL